VTLADDGTDFFGSRLKLVDAGLSPPRGRIAASPRIGISKAQAELLRFVDSGSYWLSR
jgi:3-methyladenine DNA glycosylase Mpg